MFIFNRSVSTCNFVFTTQKLLDLENMYCEGPNGRIHTYKMKDVYDATYVDAVKFLCQQMQITHGGRKRQSGGSFLNYSDEIYSKIIKPLHEILTDSILEIAVMHKDNSNQIIVLVDHVEYLRNIIVIKWPLPDESVIRSVLDKLKTST